MRADEEYTEASEGCSMNELLACFGSSDISACMAECNGDEPEEPEEPVEGREEQGTLRVSEASVQPSTSAPAGVPAIEIGSIKLTAWDEDVNLYSVSLEWMGTIAFASIKDVALQNADGVKVTRTKDLNQKWEAKISFVNWYTIKAGGSETLTVIANVAAATNWETVAFKITDFEWPETVKWTPLTTQYVSMVTNANLWSLDVSANAADTTKVKLGEEVTLWRFSIKPSNKNEDLVVKSVTLNQYGTVKTANLDDLYLTVDGKKVSSKYTVDRDDVIFTTNIELDKADTSKVDVVLKWTVTEWLGETVRFQIEESDDIVVEWQKYGTRVNVLPATRVAIPLSAAISIQGTDISVSFDKTDTTTTLATSKADFGSLKLKAESSDYTFDKLYLNLVADATAATTPYNCAATSKLADYKIVDITLWGDSYNGTPTVTCSSNKATFKVEFDDVALDAKILRNLALVVELEDAVAWTTYAWNIDLTDNDILEDITNDKKYTAPTDTATMNKLLSSTSFTTRTISVEAGWLTISETSLKAQDVVLANNKSATFWMWQFKVTNVEDATLKNLKINATTDLVATNWTTLKLEDIASKAYLVVDEKEVQWDIDGNSIVFSENVNLTKWTATDFELKLTLKAKDVIAASAAVCKKAAAVPAAASDPVVACGASPLANAAAVTAANDIYIDTPAVTNTVLFNIVAYTYKVWDNTIENSATSTIPLSPISLWGGFNIVTQWELTIDVDTTDNTSTWANLYTNIDKSVLAWSNNVVLARFKVNAKQEDIKVTDAVITLTDHNSTALTDAKLKETFKNIRLAEFNDGEFTSIAQTVTTTEDSTAWWDITFDDLSYVAKKSSTQYLYLIADVNAIDRSSAWLTAANKATVSAKLKSIAAVSDANNEDITTIKPATFTSSKNTSVRANVPAKIELLPVNLTLWDNVPVGKVKITMADQNVNINDEWVLDAILNTLNISVKWIWTTTVTDGSVKYRRDWSSLGLAATIPAADAKLHAGQEAIFNVYATVGGNAENPKVQVSVANVNTAIVINDEETSWVATLLNIGNGITPEMSVTSSMN